MPSEMNTRQQRARRLKVHVSAWIVGTILLTTLWVTNQWSANGAFESFGHEGESGQWNPTLWALAVGLWGLFVASKALRVHFDRPGRWEAGGRWRFHVAAWTVGMAILTPLWALIEWQDNGGFERFSANSQPGNWEPWILYVAGLWAAAIVALWVKAHRSRSTVSTKPS